jgi:hypothetical protein
MALPSQALFQAFVLTYGTEQRFDASSHTIWREEAVTTWDTMLCNGKKMILHGNAGEMGKYAVLSVLPDKIARFLYEYHDT